MIGAADRASVTAVLCDVDGTLFPSEQPAFFASAIVTQGLADRYGLTGDFSPEHLRRTTTGRNFRSTAGTLLADGGIALHGAELESWVRREREAVTAHLARVLRPDDAVLSAVAAMARRFELAAVSSSALQRLDACFRATDLAEFFPSHRRFSAEDSMVIPVGKPDPAIYRFALHRLGLAPEQAIAIEDSPTGAASAVGAGIRTIGLVHFVPQDEQDGVTAAILDAGASVVVATWAEAVGLLTDQSSAVPAESAAGRR